MFRARGHRIVAIAVAGTLLLSACGGDDSSSSDTTESGGGGTGGEGDGGAFAVDTGDCPDDSVTEPIEGTVKIGTTMPLSGGAAAAAFAPVAEGLENYIEYANENELAARLRDRAHRSRTTSSTRTSPPRRSRS